MKKEKPNLYEERMFGYGPFNNVNYTKGLDDLCIFYGMNETHKVLELGVCDGISTRLFAYYAESVIAIDINSASRLSENLSKNPNITFLLGDIYKLVPTLSDNYFDFIYIDANHSKETVEMDIKISLPKLKNGGIICGHDYYDEVMWSSFNERELQMNEPIRVKQAVDEYFGEGIAKVFEDSSWAIKITK